MTIHRPVEDAPQGQATFGMSNLRKERTGLPFVVFISQKDGARHDIGVKVSPFPKDRTDKMSAYALRPFRPTNGPGLSSADAALLRRWSEANMTVLVDYWDGAIEYTDDAVSQIKSI